MSGRGDSLGLAANAEKPPGLRLLAALYAVATSLAGALVGAFLSLGCENVDTGTGHYWVCEVLNDYGGYPVLVAGPVLAVLFGASRARAAGSRAPLHRAAIAAAVGVVVIAVVLPVLADALWPS